MATSRQQKGAASRAARHARNATTKTSKSSSSVSSKDAASIQKQIDAAKGLVDKLYTDRGLTAPNSGSSFQVPEGQTVMERYGEVTDFGPAAGPGGRLPGETKQQARDRISGSNFSFAGGGGAVVSNANLVEKVVPYLDSKASGLYGSSSTGDGGDSLGGYGGEQDFAELMGLTDGKKKKKKNEQDAFSPTGGDPYVDAQMTLLEQMARSQDKATREYIKQTQKSFNERQAQQERSNESGLAQVKQALNLAGSSRYAPISSSGIISSKEAQGIQALKALDAEENQIIAEIKQAQVDRDYQIMEKKMGILETVRQEKASAAQELQTASEEATALGERDDMIADMVMQGITNPVEVFQNLRAAGVNTSMGDVAASLKGLNELGSGFGGIDFKLDNKAIGLLLGSGLTAPDIQAMQSDLASGASLDDILGGLDAETQNIVRKSFGVDSVTGPVQLGVGATDELSERAIRSQLEPKLMGILNKGAVSDEDRAYVRGEIAFYRDQGLSSQQILDIFSGWSADVDTPYNGAFRDAILANDTDGQGTSPTLTRVGSLLANKNYTGAMDAVEGLAMTNARKLDPDNYLGQASAQFAIKSARDLKKSIKDAEDILGPLEGTWENVKGRLAKSKDPRAAQISADIARLTAPMRNQLSGTAVTESETRFLEPLIPTLSDNMENFSIKVNSLENMALDRFNATRQSVSLPAVTSDQVLDRKQRVNAYSGDIYSRNAKSVDI